MVCVTNAVYVNSKNLSLGWPELRELSVAMIEVQLESRKGRFWLGELPDWTFDVAEVHETRLAAPSPRLDGERSVAMELLIYQGPRISYGGLGAVFQPNATGTLMARICTSADAGAIEQGTLTGQMDMVHRGFLEEYVSGVFKGVAQADTAQILGAGTLCICRAVHGELGSSQAIFNLLGRIVARLLCITNGTLSLETLIELLRGKLAQ